MKENPLMEKELLPLEDIVKRLEWMRSYFHEEEKWFEEFLIHNALYFLKEQQEKIRQLESMNVSASGNGTAIGVLHGGITIKKEYHQQAKEVYNIGHIDRLDL